jgi:hypothetical protein
MMRELRLTSTADLFVAQIVAARTEAIKRGSTVILCRTGDPMAITYNDGSGNPNCASAIHPGGGTLAARDWSYGWLAYATAPGFFGERNYTPADGDLLVGVGDPGHRDRGVTVRSNTVGNSWLTFQGDGSLNEDGLAVYAVCDERGVSSGRLVTVFLDGEARIDELAGSAVDSCSPSG